MPAPTSDYYSLEKTAEVLGLPTAEVNRLREKSMLRAFRDGTSWKFRKSDVDDYLVQTIKNRGKVDPDAADSPSDSGFDLLNSSDDGEEAPTLLADSASFDSLMEDGDGLAINEGLVDAKPTAGPKVSLDKNAAPKKQPGKSDVDLANDGLVLAENKTSSNLDLAGDSGLSLMNLVEEDLKPSKSGSDAELELDEDSDILSLMEDSALVENTQAVVKPPKEDDFKLADLEDTALTDDAHTQSSSSPLSSSSGAVTSFAKSSSVSSKSASAAVPDFSSESAADDFGDFNAPDGDLANDMFGGGVVPPSESPFASAGTASPVEGAFSAGTDASTFSGDFASTPSTFATAASAKTEAEYKAGTVVSLISLAVILIFPGIMLLDLMRNIWSWNGEFVINSTLMDMIVGMVGLK